MHLTIGALLAQVVLQLERTATRRMDGAVGNVPRDAFGFTGVREDTKVGVTGVARNEEFTGVLVEVTSTRVGALEWSIGEVIDLDEHVDDHRVVVAPETLVLHFFDTVFHMLPFA